MSWSIQVSNGDLMLGTQGLNTVTGASKLTQDLRCTILTHTGTDPLHPDFGSTLDGGIDPQGNPVTGVIGQTNDKLAAAFVAAEVQRICQTYQGQQIARNNTDVATYGKSTLTADEALLSIQDIATQQIMDHLLVTATLQTGAGGLPLAIPFTK